jgi:hypothetical protein
MNRQFKAALLISLFAAVAVFPTTGHTQSGRRQTKPPSAAPIPAPTSEPTPARKEQTKSDLVFVAGIDRSDTFSYYPMSFYSAVLEGCAAGLKRNTSASVTTSERMTRGDAVKKAKSEKTAYTVWLHLTSLAMANAERVEDLQVEFTVFGPTTAKILTNGVTYPNATRKGPIVVQPPGRTSTSILYQEQLLKRAGEDAGVRITKALHITSNLDDTATTFHFPHRVAQ